MKKILSYKTELFCVFLMILGMYGMFLGIPKSEPTFSEPEDMGWDRGEMLNRAETCDDECKRRHNKLGHDVVGRLKTSPDVDRLICNCYQKKIKGMEM